MTICRCVANVPTDCNTLSVQNVLCSDGSDANDKGGGARPTCGYWLMGFVPDYRNSLSLRSD